MNLPFKFPVSLEEFMAYQANLVGRKLPRSTKNLVLLGITVSVTLERRRKNEKQKIF